MFATPLTFVIQLLTLAIAGIVTVYIASFFGHAKFMIAYMVVFGVIAMLIFSAFSRCSI